MNSLLKSSRYFTTYGRINLSKVLFSKKYALELYQPSFTFVSGAQPLATFQNAVRFLSTSDHNVISEPCSNDKFAEEILNLKTCDDVLNYIGNIQKPLTLNHALVALNYIYQKHYEDVRIKNSNLLENMHVSYVQLLLQGDLEKTMKPIHDHEQFQALLKFLKDSCDMIEIDKVSNVLLLLIYMNIHFEDPIFLRLVNRMKGNIPSMDHGNLLTASYVIKSLPGIQSDLTKLCLKRLKTLIEINDSPTFEELNNIVIITTIFLKFITDHTMKWIFEWTIKSIEGFNFSDEPRFITPLMRFFYNCTHFQLVYVPTTVHSRLEEAYTQNLHLLNMFEIQDLCRSLKYSVRAKENLIAIMGKRVEKVLSDDVRSSELSCLLSAMSKFTPKDTLSRIQNALAIKLSNPEEKFDLVLLSSIADTLVDVDPIVDDLTKFLQKRIAENSEGIVDYLSRFIRISKFLSKYPFKDPDDEQRFVEVVVRYIEGKHGLSLLTMTSLASYLLTLENTSQIPHHTYLKLISSLPRWCFRNLFSLLAAVDLSLQNSSGEKKQHFIELSSRIQQIIALKLAEASEEKSFDFATSPFVITMRFSNSSLNHAILSSFERTADNIDIIKARRIIKFLSISNYYVPVLFEGLVNQVIDDPCAINNAISILRICARANYVPKRMPEFIDILRDVFKKEFEGGFYKQSLVILNCLAMLHFYLKEELKEFFKLEVLQGLEKLVEEAKQHDRSSEYNLMNLNRCVAIECPEINIPWFLENYCVDKWLKRKGEHSRNIENFKGEVYSYLIDIFGSSKYIKRESFSPYFHKIDFECALNKDNRPISASVLDSNPHRHFQRLAICMLHENNFCKDSKSLTGKDQMKKRHLEVLNYKLVEIPYFEWYSMGMSEKSSRLAYLKKKIDNVLFGQEISS